MPKGNVGSMDGTEGIMSIALANLRLAWTFLQACLNFHTIDWCTNQLLARVYRLNNQLTSSSATRGDSPPRLLRQSVDT